jgi:outer membrane protein assembly factor BamD
MSLRKIAKLLLPLMVVALISQCATVKGWFGKKKGPDKAPETLAQEGIDKLKKKKYDDAIDNFAKIRDRYPYSQQALLAQIKVADSYFYKKKYDEARNAYAEFEKLHPTNKAVPYCIYRQGLCYYRQRSTIDRDQKFTVKAMQEFRRLKQKYPKSEHIAKADKFLARCRKDLMEHEYYVADFYFRTKRYSSALERFQTLLQEYPEFPKKDKVKKDMAECRKILATKDKRKGGFSFYANYLFDAKW